MCAGCFMYIKPAKQSYKVNVITVSSITVKKIETQTAEPEYDLFSRFRRINRGNSKLGEEREDGGSMQVKP